jgi:polysaccharide biosynthesis/export protein
MPWRADIYAPVTAIRLGDRGLTSVRLCRSIHFVKQSTSLRRWFLGAALCAGLPALSVAQQIPPRPPGMSDEQLRQELRNRGLGDVLRQRIQQSGLTPDQIRARLRAAGYPENLIDEYMRPAQPGRDSVAPSAQVLRAARTLGFTDFELNREDTLVFRDSVVLTRADSLFLDSLEFDLTVDSVPLVPDSTGVMRLDTAAARRFVLRLRRPRVFGLDVFRRATSQFAAVATGPVDASYRVGPGDELVLILTGDVEQVHQLAVSREGFVVIPQVGQIAVANLTLGQLRSLLYQRVGRVYSSVRDTPNATTRLDLTVTRVRTNQIFVTGDVARPGAYPVSALGTVLNALYQAGGPSERGSFRDVRVVRAGAVVRTVDLYDYLVRGGTTDDIRLENGDVVFVPPRGAQVTITGRVLRPGIYELKPGDDLRTVIAAAGGLQADAYTGRASIERVLPVEQRGPDGRERIVVDVDVARAMAGSGPATPLMAGDKVEVFAVVVPVRGRVEIAGGVWRPGTFALVPGMRLSQLVASAGGLRDVAYRDRVHIVRTLPDSTRRLIPVDLRAGAADPELMEFDRITVFSRVDFRGERTISVFGAVNEEGTVEFADSMTLRDAVLLAGGLRDEAYLLEAEISRVPATPGRDTAAILIRVPLDSTYVVDPTGYFRRATAGRAESPVLYPYDNVFIRALPAWSVQRNVVITGEVRFPGRYTLHRPDERLADVLRRAGGFTDAAYAAGTQFHRPSARTRVGLDVERLMRDGGHRDNLILLAGDSIVVPRYQPVVLVEGSVNAPTGVSFAAGRSADYYVERAGGFTRRADRKRTYIVQANGAVATRGEQVLPGARVVVPELPPGTAPRDWVPIVQAAAGVLSSLVAIIVVLNQR